MNKSQTLTVIGYVIVFTAGILFGTAVNISQTKQRAEIFAQQETLAVEIEETPPSEIENGVYYLKIEDGVLRQYRVNPEGIMLYEKDLPYIDVLSLSSEYSERLNKGVTLAGTLALAEYIENLDS